MELQAKGKVDFKKLITHIIPAHNIQNAFILLEDRDQSVVQLVLSFDEE